MPGTSVVDNDGENGMGSKFNEISEMVSGIMKNLHAIETKFDAKFASLQKQLSRVEVVLKSRRIPVSQPESNPNIEFCEQDPECLLSSDLKEMGFPVADMLSLTDIEKNLDDNQFETNAVMFTDHSIN